jgi:peptidoglycan-N-acetylglucosamine deacetylase
MLKNAHIIIMFSGLLVLLYFPANLSVGVSLIISVLAIISFIALNVFNIRYSLFLHSICKIKTGEPIVFLTFDDGPSEKTTPGILDILKKNQIQATFFCIGKKVECNKNLLLQIFNDGHAIGSHTYSHKWKYAFDSLQNVMKEISSCTNLILEMTGQKPVLFRPPYGVITPIIAAAIKRNNSISVGWTIRSFDTISKNRDKLIKKIVTRTKPGSIVLLHDSLEITLNILPELIKQLTIKGYKISKLPDYLG